MSVQSVPDLHRNCGVLLAPGVQHRCQQDSIPSSAAQHHHLPQEEELGSRSQGHGKLHQALAPFADPALLGSWGEEGGFVAEASLKS